MRHDVAEPHEERPTRVGAVCGFYVSIFALIQYDEERKTRGRLAETKN